MFLQVNHIKKVYGKGPSATTALKDINFSVNKGEFVAIMGESGSGKTTLLNIIATLDKPTNGSVILDGTDFTKLSDSKLAAFRREKLGFVFQDFNVLNTLNNKDNIFLPLVLSNTPVEEMESRLNEIAPLLGISQLLDKFPYEVSGGQRQRIAVARAIITRPDLILADELTGALDSKSSENLLDLFQDINQSDNTILMVTHSVKAAAASKRVLFIQDGIIYNEIYRGSDTERDFALRIQDSLALLHRGDM